MSWIFMPSVFLAPVLHIIALYLSRQGRSRIHTAAFWGGVIGLLSLPAAIFASLAYLPFAITGAGDHPISWILPTTWIALWGLSVWSLVVAAAIWRRRSV
ncbi:hypothetical protein K3217_20860 [bacterium BD-1]|nr:hypothetical protein [Ottowia caeni]